jgi:hypothetical protein
MADPLFQGSSSTTSRRAKILRHIDPSLVSRTTYFQRDQVILIFYTILQYEFIDWFLYHFAERAKLGVGGGGGGCGVGGLRGCGVGGELGWRIGGL